MVTKQPRKIRKRIHEGKLNLLRKFMLVHLSKELRGKYKTRSISVRVGDTVKILRGKFSGKSGRVSKVNIKKQKVYVDGIDISKVSGTKAKVGIHPSNLMITSLDLSDKYRQKLIERKGGVKK